MTSDPSISAPRSLDDLAEEYTRTRDPAVREKVFHELKPTINFALTRFAGGASDPVMRSKAYALAISSLDKFDPQRGVNVKTFVVNNLQPLSRQRRLHSSPTRQSDRMQLDSMTLDRMRNEFEDKHGREPTEDDLADLTGLTPSRVRRVRQSSMRVPSEASGGFPEETAVASAPLDLQSEAVDYLYDSASPLDRKILHDYLGFNGGPKLSARAFAERERIGLATVSTRAHKLMDEVQKITAILEKAAHG